MTSLTSPEVPARHVMPKLASLCQAQGLPELSARLERISALLQSDLSLVEADLASISRKGDVVQRSAAMLIEAGGKRLRPICVALAARAGTGFGPQARDLAVAVELVHSATLLHDDVVDLGDSRRGAPTARTVFGNASSIFAGDWLLVAALRRVQRTGLPDVLCGMFDAIDEMIVAEAAQLESRGRIVADRGAWKRVVKGKTAALFRWGLFAGARAGGLCAPACAALQEFGSHLGVGFQAVDDVLDLVGDPRETGKACFVDLHEGRLTLPLIIAVEADPALLEPLRHLAAVPPDSPGAAALRLTILDGVARTRATQQCIAVAREYADRAVACLDAVEPGEARDALQAVALATILRQT